MVEQKVVDVCEKELIKIHLIQIIKKETNLLIGKVHGELSKHHWRKICDGAKDRKIEVKITIEEAWDQFLKQDRICPLTGLKLEFRKTAKDNTQTASLDRIDSSKSYELGNIQWVHKRVNTMKMDMSEKELIDFCKLIVEKNCGRNQES